MIEKLDVTWVRVLAKPGDGTTGYTPSQHILRGYTRAPGRGETLCGRRADTHSTAERRTSERTCETCFRAATR